jgi:hypothetical protein
MPKICLKCNKEFPIWIKIKEKNINCGSRKYCLECSPRGKHNTKKLHHEDAHDYVKNSECDYRCGVCGETDKTKFYGKKKKICGKCHNQYTLKKGQEKRKYAIGKLGGKCCKCGYSKYIGAIDIHHIDTSKKDEKFSQLRGWSYKRIDKEIENCVAVCKVCHAEIHANLLKI